MDQPVRKPTLLFNDECAVCRVIAHWVRMAAERQVRDPSIIVRPIGDDPEALRALNPSLDIWDAYANIHLLMPDGSMKIDGDAVAETLRTIPATKWLARSFNVRLFGWRPFQGLLNVAYTLLADIRPLLGCESCGIPSPWLRPFHWIAQKIKRISKPQNQIAAAPHLTVRSTLKSTLRSSVV